MRYRTLGAAGVKVSELCLGTMTFGEADASSFMHKVGCSEETSLDLMDRALDAGVNFWDTADVYGQDGLSERIVGNWIGSRGRRNDIVLATKARFAMGIGPNDRGANRYHLVRAVEDSLRRLQTDRIDLYQIHMQDISVEEEEVLSALTDLQRAGKIVYFGCSNYAAYRLVESLWTSDKRCLSRHVTLQASYSLVQRELDREHLPAMERHGLGLLPFSPLAGGFLTGKFRRGAAAPQGSRLTTWEGRLEKVGTDRNWRILDATIAVAEELDATPAQVALAWCLTRPTVSSVIFGARSVSQLDDNLGAADLEIPQPLLDTLEEASALEVDYPYSFISQVDGRW